MATLLRPGEATAETRSTAGTICTVIERTGYTEAGGGRMDWAPNDLFVVPNHTRHRHSNASGSADGGILELTR